MRNYRPSASALPPNSTRTLSYKPPIEGDEQPVVLSQNMGDIVVSGMTRNVDETLVTLTNKADVLTPYVMAIVPSAYVTMAMIPWKEILKRAWDDVPSALGRMIGSLISMAPVTPKDKP